MKSLFIIRHAKSDQNFFGNDFERPLNTRGKGDAPLMAKRLIEKNIDIEIMVASPALRAKQTAEHFAEIFTKSKESIIYISALYHASADVFYDVVADLPDEFSQIAIFSHNPGITHFVASLQTSVELDNMPTCGVFAVETDIIRWKDFLKAKKSFVLFEYPKK